MMGASQHIWLPHEQRRAPLEDYLDQLIGDDKENYIWKAGVVKAEILNY